MSCFKAFAFAIVALSRYPLAIPRWPELIWFWVGVSISLLRTREGGGMIQSSGPEFDVASYLAHAGLGRKIVKVEPKHTLFSQGDPADSIFYLQNGRAKLTVASQTGKEATITILNAGDFAGEESLTATNGLRLATATAITHCIALEINQ